MQKIDKKNKESENYILQNYKKTYPTAIFNMIVFIIIATAVAITGVVFDVW